MAVYFDASALVKFAIEEAESAAVRAFARHHTVQYSCALVRVELVRAVRRHDPARLASANDVLSQVAIINLDSAILERAAVIEPPEVRSLDAIHIAAALTLGDELEAIVTYDAQMQAAARALGLHVEAPA